MKLSVFALICLSLTACATLERGSERISLVKTGQVHVDDRGINITTPVFNTDKSTVEIETTLKNEASDVTVVASTLIQDKEGKILYQISSPVKITAGGKKIVIHTIEMLYPELWSELNPYLYTAIIEVKVGNKLTDRHQTVFGIHPPK